MRPRHEELPAEIERAYAGRWIAWDPVDEQVIADGESMEDVVLLAAQHPAADEHPIWYDHIVASEPALAVGV